MAIKILVVAFALFALRRVVTRYRKGAALPAELIFWGLIWAGLAIVVFIPRKTDILAQWLGVASGFDALTFLTIVGLLYAVYRLYARVQNVERDLTRLVRATALQAALPPGAKPRDAVVVDTVETARDPGHHYVA